MGGVGRALWRSPQDGIPPAPGDPAAEAGDTGMWPGGSEMSPETETAQ